MGGLHAYIACVILLVNKVCETGKALIQKQNKIKQNKTRNIY